MEFTLDMVSLLKMLILLSFAVNVNITFIGPSPEAINQMGTKDVASETMRKQVFQLYQVQKELLKR